MKKWSLPSQWEWSALEDIVDVGSYNIEPKNDPSKEFNYVGLENIEKGTGKLVNFAPQPGQGIKSAKSVFEKGDVLYGKLRPYLQKTIVAPFDGVSATDLVPLKPHGSGRYVFHYLLGPDHIAYISPLMAGIRMPRLRAGDLKGMPIPCPPLNEQRHIADKIDALQAKSRRAREALETAKPLLEKFRQSVLATAFRGDLTAEWRKQNPDVEPASKLLERIRAERRTRWEEAELAKMQAKGKEPKNDKWKAKYKEPEPVDTRELPELPEGWCWIRVKELASDEPRSIQSGPFGSNLKHSEFQNEGVLVIGIDNVHNADFRLGKQNRISQEKYEELKKYTARPLDVLITVMATVGRCCVVPENIETSIITKHVYRTSVEQKLCIPYFLMFSLLGAQTVLKQIAKQSRGQTRDGINGGILKELAIPVPPLEEQSQIVSKLNLQEEAISKQLDALEVLSNSCDRLDQSILAKAFRGELVPQDPNDEPASVLLERIKAERETAKKSKPRRKRKKK